ncbi:hypothetical protein PV682_31115 [Streptomyces niveiscabiei]|uniref:hypothetical protein n=1 Tax=Streptomyces niveiscabiei TaxID=164115 RepID=UPI0029A6E291|nr:hypothetical protein [Streptomyces niveiscabiei]MDX3385876.1 hypothetical protein [Streptomyces niveiscabiei]
MTRPGADATRATGTMALVVAALVLALDSLTTGGHVWVSPLVVSLTVLGSGLRIEAAVRDRPPDEH